MALFQQSRNAEDARTREHGKGKDEGEDLRAETDSVLFLFRFILFLFYEKQDGESAAYDGAHGNEDDIRDPPARGGTLICGFHLDLRTVLAFDRFEFRPIGLTFYGGARYRGLPVGKRPDGQNASITSSARESNLRFIFFSLSLN